MINPVSSYKIQYFYPKTKNNVKKDNELSLSTTQIPNNYKYDLISFKGAITTEQKNKCHKIIHLSSAACGAISGSMGEGACVGADTPLLWGTQGIMFLKLQNLLNISTADHIMYIGRQYMIGNAIGVGGAKALISLFGIAGHAASGGTLSGPITTGVRAINGLLSTAITEKMGWGYVSAYKNDKMNFKRQSIETLIYGVGCCLFGNLGHDIADTTSPIDVQSALDSISKTDISTYGKILNILTNDIHADRFAFMFVTKVIQDVCLKRGPFTKEELKRNISLALLNTVVYDLLDDLYEKAISKEAMETIKTKLSKSITETPEAFKEFSDFQDKVITDLKISQTSKQEFLNQFKDRNFVHNLALLASGASRSIIQKVRERNFNKYGNERQKLNIGLCDNNGNTLSKEDMVGIENSIRDMLIKIKKEQNIKTRPDYGFDKIGGYENLKMALSAIITEPIKNQSDKTINSVLFYGPSGVGKTYIGSAIAESCNGRFLAKSANPFNEKKMYEKILEFVENSDKVYAKQGRHSFCQINEADAFLNNNPKLARDFIELIKDCSKKHHCTFLLTTNNPLLVNNEIAKKIDLIVPVNPPSKSDTEAIVKLYLNNKQLSDEDFKRFVNAINEIKPNSSYNNKQIKDFVDIILHNDYTGKKIIDIIKSLKPCILKETLEKFEQEKKILTGEQKCF